MEGDQLGRAVNMRRKIYDRQEKPHLQRHQVQKFRFEQIGHHAQHQSEEKSKFSD